MSLRNFSYFFQCFLPDVHHVQPPVQAGRMDRWTTYGMLLVSIGHMPHMAHGRTEAHTHKELAQREGA